MKTQMNKISKRNGVTIYQFTATSRRAKEKITFVANIPGRGLIAVVWWREIMKVAKFLSGTSQDISSVMGLPMLATEEQLPNEIAQAKAMMERVVTSVLQPA